MWGFTRLGLNPFLARVISISTSMVFTFFLNRTLTFGKFGTIGWAEIVAYVGASGIGAGINYLVFAGGIKLGLPWFPAIALGTIIAAAFNFVAYGRIFKSGEN